MQVCRGPTLKKNSEAQEHTQWYCGPRTQHPVKDAVTVPLNAGCYPTNVKAALSSQSSTSATTGCFQICPDSWEIIGGSSSVWKVVWVEENLQGWNFPLRSVGMAFLEALVVHHAKISCVLILIFNVYLEGLEGHLPNSSSTHLNSSLFFCHSLMATLSGLNYSPTWHKLVSPFKYLS